MSEPIFVKEDHEAGKVVQKPCLFTRQSRSEQLYSRCDIFIQSRTRATKSRDKIARVSSVSRPPNKWCQRRYVFVLSVRVCVRACVQACAFISEQNLTMN